MANIDEYQIRDLACGEHRWRIDWFGPVTYAERYRRKSQPLIEIQLSQLPDDLTDFNELFSLKNDQWPKTRQVRLPVGFLPLLKIGDIWQDGRLVESPQYALERLDNLRIDRNNASLIKAGLSEDDDRSFYLPISHHPYHVRHTHSYCVLVKAGAYNIIIPSVELIRFYFGSSSTLVSKIFEAPFSSENLWVGTEPEDASRKPKIHLAPGISGRSASDIGRVAFSKSARSAVELIGNSCITATANQQRAYPKAVFPFEGGTDLVASGKWLPFGGNERGVFLVFKLVSCSHPFPFLGLRYTSERKGPSGKNTQFGSASESSDGKQEKRFFKSLQETKAIIDEEPSRAKKPRGLGLLSDVGMQFPDLARKPVSKVDVDQVPTVLHSLKGVSIVSGSSVGDRGKDVRVQPIELIGTSGGSIALTGKSAKENTLTTAVFLNLTAKLLESDRFVSVDIVRLDPRQRFDYLSTMPMIVDEDGEVLPSCVVAFSKDDENDARTESRNRRISICRAMGLYTTHYLMVPESMEAINNSKGRVELHLIIDHSRSISTTDDLLAAIASHFSLRSDVESKAHLGPGVESMYFEITHTEAFGDAALNLAEKLYENIQSSFTNSISDTNVASNHPQVSRNM